MSSTFVPTPAGRGAMSPAGPRNILARARATLLGVQVIDGISDDDEIPLDAATGLLKRPYIDLQFGTPILMAQSRSLAGARAQPYRMTFTADCWAATADEARTLGFAVMDVFLEWIPEEGNTDQIEGFGGGDFRLKDSAGRPTRHCARRQFQYVVGMASPE